MTSGKELQSAPTYKQIRRYRGLVWCLTLMLLISMACSLPTFGRTPTASPTATTAAGVVSPAPGIVEQTAEPIPAVELPPALVETDPLPSSVLAPDAAPVLYFNQPMERASVEGALQMEPDVPVRLEWLDDATLRVVPDSPLAADSSLQLTIDAGAQAANGQTLAEPVLIQYAMPGELRVAERIPASGVEELNPSSVVAVTFNQPVVGLGADPASLPAAFTITGPDGTAPAGRGEWVNTSTYLFYPEPVLMGGADYSVQINPALSSTAGAQILSDDAAQAWTFSTAAPAVVSIQPGTEQPVELDAAFVLTFNQPMNAGSVENNFVLTRPDGSPVQGTFAWNETATEVEFQPGALLERGTAYGLVLFGAAQSQGGAALGTDFAASIVTVPQFSVTSTTPAAGEALEVFFGYASMQVAFSAPLAPGQNLQSLVRLTPEVSGLSVTRGYEGYQLFMSGYFAPGTSYSLEILPELKDRWGATLGTPFTYNFSTLPAQPFLSLPRTVFVPYGETNLPVRAVNIERLALSRGALTIAEFIASQESWNGIENWQSKVQSEWVRLNYPTPNVTETIAVPLHQNDELLPPGLYFLNVATTPAGDNAPLPSLVVVSPIHLTLKTSLRQAFVWAVRLGDQSPAANLAVTIYDPNGQPVAGCTTDANGVCEAELPPVDEYEVIYYAAIGQPGDPDFSMAAGGWNNGVEPWHFSVGYERETLAPEVYLYTDRPIYRPDQLVHFRALVRSEENGRFSAPPNQSITVEVISPYDPITSQSPVLTTLNMPLDDYGSASGVYQLADDARPGTYTLRVKEGEYSDLYFTVAEYRKPEIDVQVNFTAADKQFGEDVEASVTASYFFGAPAGNVPVRWTLYSSPASPNLPDGLTVGPLDTDWMIWEFEPQFLDFYVAEGAGVTAQDGTLSITILGDTIRERLEGQSDQMVRLRLEVTLEDESGLPVSSRAQMNYHPTPYYAGVRAEQWMVTAGEEITYTIRTVDWQGQPVGERPLRASFRKVTWVQEESTDLYSPPTFRMEATDVGSTEFTSSATGEARLAFQPAEPGTFLLQITGEGGVVTEVLIWVGGEGNALWPETPNQRLQLRSDSTAYQPGQEARIFLPNPFSGEALALVTVERGRVMRSQVIAISAASHELVLPLSGEDAPNVFVTVTLMGRTGGRPDFRVGILELEVAPVEEVLDVSVEASPLQAQPGEEATITIRVRDTNGEPVQGQFSLALVDKAVLALADPNSEPIVEALYGPNWLGVRSSYPLTVYAGRAMYMPPGRGGGGGGGDFATPTVRENFADTAFWSGAIETDVTGVAQITLTLPDNLTTWVADVRGVTSDTRVGQAELELVASKPLLIRPVTPRFAVVGDHIELSAVVQNNTPDALRASVRLEGSGFTFDDPDNAAQPVDLPAGQRAEVRWWGTVQDIDALDLTFRAEAGALRDATRPETGLIPVLRYTAPETFATSGMLTEAGTERELVSLPRSFTPVGGELRVELSPSLTAAVLTGLEALEDFPHDFTEPVVSRLLPNLITLSALKEAQLDDQALRGELESAILTGTDRLVRLQNEDGGWGWAMGRQSDPYLSSYVMLALTRASQEGVFVDPLVLQRGQEYLFASLLEVNEETETWLANRQAFQHYVLLAAGRQDADPGALYEFRAKLSPWGQAFLALALETQNPGDERARTLLADLSASASRTASGANWQDPDPHWSTWSTPLSTTAIVTYALARLDPASPLLVDSVRYLALNRQPNGGWRSSFETAWALMAMIETVRGTGDLQADYAFSANLNSAPLASGQASSPAQALNPVTAETPLETLLPDTPNELEIQRGEGSGRLYYRAYLNVSRPVESAPPVKRGLEINRQYYRAGQDCRVEDCQPVIEASLADPQPLIVRLSLTLPEDMYYLVVEDVLPAGVEVLNPRLNTTQQQFVPEETGEGQQPSPYSLENPFEEGWGWWYFSDPQVYDDRVRWVVDYLPAGTYELTYRVTPFLAGEFRLIPAHAYQYYFTEVEATTGGGILSIR